MRMMLEHQFEYQSQWAAIATIVAKFGSTSETLEKWVRRAEVDEGYSPLVSIALVTSTNRTSAKHDIWSLCRSKLYWVFGWGTS